MCSVDYEIRSFQHVMYSVQCAVCNIHQDNVGANGNGVKKGSEAGSQDDLPVLQPGQDAEEKGHAFRIKIFLVLSSGLRCLCYNLQDPYVTIGCTPDVCDDGQLKSGGKVRDTTGDLGKRVISRDGEASGSSTNTKRFSPSL